MLFLFLLYNLSQEISRLIMAANLQKRSSKNPPITIQLIQLQMLYFIFEKSRFYNNYLLIKLSGSCIAEISTSLAAFQKFQQISPISDPWTLLLTLSDTISVMLSLKLQHTHLEKALQSQMKGLDVKLLKSLYIFTLNSLERLNEKVGGVILSSKRRSSLEQYLLQANAPVSSIQFMGGTSSSYGNSSWSFSTNDKIIKEFANNIKEILEANTTILYFYSNICEVIERQGEKEIKLYLARLARDFEPIIINLEYIALDSNPVNDISEDQKINKESKKKSILTNPSSSSRPKSGKNALSNENLISQLMNEFTSIINTYYYIQQKTLHKPSEYWEKCGELNRKLKAFLEEFQEKIFGPFKYLLLGIISKPRYHKKLCSSIALIAQKFHKSQILSSSHQILHHYYAIASGLHSNAISRSESLAALQVLYGSKYLCPLLKLCFEIDKIPALEEALFKAAMNLNINTMDMDSKSKSNIKKEKQEEGIIYQRFPVTLILDSKLNNFPFESLPIFRTPLQLVSRMPSLSHLVYLCDSMKGAAKNIINPNSGYYILNPSGDLQSTQKAFESYFSVSRKWIGIAGKEPQTEEVMNALQKFELFIYCGHGSGETFYSAEDLRKIDIK